MMSSLKISAALALSTLLFASHLQMGLAFFFLNGIARDIARQRVLHILKQYPDLLPEVMQLQQQQMQQLQQQQAMYNQQFPNRVNPNGFNTATNGFNQLQQQFGSVFKSPDQAQAKPRPAQNELNRVDKATPPSPPVLDVETSDSKTGPEIIEREPVARS